AYNAPSMLGSVVFGSRTWIWTIAAPALAASTAEAAICSGVTGTAGFFPAESAAPVSAHEIMTLRCTAAPPGGSEVVANSLQRLGGTGYGIAAGSAPCAPCTPLCAALSLG